MRAEPPERLAAVGTDTLLPAGANGADVIRHGCDEPRIPEPCACVAGYGSVRRVKPSTARGIVTGLLLGSGGVAIGTAGAVVTTGTRAIPGGGTATPSTDSVLRFYATWWGGSGVAMMAAATAPDPSPSLVRGVAAATFVGGLARLAAARRSGAPHPLFQTLTAFELLTPPLLLFAQRRAA